MPDLTGLFCGWHGATGIITKLSLKLFPKRKILDVVGIVTNDLDMLPSVLNAITHTEMADNLFIVGMLAAGAEGPGPQFITVNVTGDLPEEIDYKRAVFKRLSEELGGEEKGIHFMKKVPSALKKRFIEKPLSVEPALAADFSKGGGYRYCGAILPVNLIPEAWRRGVAIARDNNRGFMSGIQVLGFCHSAMFGFVYPFNRADEKSVNETRRAMAETNRMVLDLGGIPWKAEVSAQEEIMAKMDPNTARLMATVKAALDPNNIMNPGNWSTTDGI